MRISLFVDGGNFFYMQRNDLGWWVDPRKLLDYIRSKGELIDANYYVGKDVHPEARQDKYLRALTYMGYSLITKDLKNVLREDGTYKQRANLDIEIVLDMFNTIEHYDMAVLVSGDGDFERSISLLKARGKRYLVMATKNLIARELREAVGMHYEDFHDLRGYVEKSF
ncbi:MAG: NYN domain-containing protein [Firmicutes bacterium]|nr:NYN domain-containing protein [Bacillota bacterium]